MFGDDAAIVEGTALQDRAESSRIELLNRCLGDLDFVERVLAAFFDQFSQDLQDLRCQVTAQDSSQIASIAHRMKGASANVAASELNRCAMEIEHLAREERLEDIALLLEELNRQWMQFADSASSCTAPSKCL